MSQRVDKLGIPDKRTDLERMTVHRNRALRSLNEIVTAAQAVIDAYPELLSAWEADTITPMDTLLMKVAVWGKVDDEPSLADYGITVHALVVEERS